MPTSTLILWHYSQAGWLPRLTPIPRRLSAIVKAVGLVPFTPTSDRETRLITQIGKKQLHFCFFLDRECVCVCSAPLEVRDALRGLQRVVVVHPDGQGPERRCPAPFCRPCLAVCVVCVPGTLAATYTSCEVHPAFACRITDGDYILCKHHHSRVVTHLFARPRGARFESHSVSWQVLSSTQMCLPSSTFSSQPVGRSQVDAPFFDCLGVRCLFAGQQLRLCGSNTPRPLNYHGMCPCSHLHQVTAVWLITISVDTISVDRGTQIGADPCGSTFFIPASPVTVHVQIGFNPCKLK